MRFRGTTTEVDFTVILSLESFPSNVVMNTTTNGCPTHVLGITVTK